MLIFKSEFNDETIGVSAGKQWTRLTFFDSDGRQYYQEKYYTPIMNLYNIEDNLIDVLGEVDLVKRIIDSIKKSIQ